MGSTVSMELPRTLKPTPDITRTRKGCKKRNQTCFFSAEPTARLLYFNMDSLKRWSQLEHTPMIPLMYRFSRDNNNLTDLQSDTAFSSQSAHYLSKLRGVKSFYDYWISCA